MKVVKKPFDLFLLINVCFVFLMISFDECNIVVERQFIVSG